MVNTYRTADGRFVALCMLQADKYWRGFCTAAGRPELVEDPRYRDAAARKENLDDCVAELKALFASRTLSEWREILSRQRGPWDVVQHVGELGSDSQVQANAMLQPVRLNAGREVRLVSVPMQFDGAPLSASGAPDIGQDSETVLTGLGYDDEAVINLKVAGVVF